MLVLGHVVRDSLSLHPTEAILNNRFQRRIFVSFKKLQNKYIAESFVP